MSSSPPRPTLDAVLPLALAGGHDGFDLSRAVLQGRTLRRFFRQSELLRVHVVCCDAERQKAVDALGPLEAPWLNYSFRDERDIHSDLTRSPADGWHKQQIIKMAAPEWLGSPFWLTLDADVICTKPVGIDDLLPDGRALLSLVDVPDTEIFMQWAWASRELLGSVAPPSTFGMSITPLLYAEPIMRATHEAIQAIHGRPWKDVLLDGEIARQQRERHGNTWTENFLYYAVGARSGLLRHCHAIAGIDASQTIIADGVWRNCDWPNWNPEFAFDRARPGFFAVCSSYTGMAPDFVARRIEPYLGPDAAATAPAPARMSRYDEHDENAVVKPDFRGRIVCHRPLILAGPHDGKLSGLSCILSNDVLKPLREIPATVLVSLPSSREPLAEARRLAARVARRQAELPLHRFVILCNTDVELENFRQLGFACVLVNGNALVDERPFLATHDVKPEFDAVYNAGFHPAKRHELAAGISSLALIYANWHDIPPYAQYRAESLRALSHATILNQAYPGDAYRFFDRHELARQLARARVGLCLSEEEGAMRASVEYLHAGLPIVSTLNRGGRDQIFDADFCVTVPPSPSLIAEAVRELASRQVARDHVRLRTMHRIGNHRERFADLVVRSAAAMGHQRIPPVKWPWLDDHVYTLRQPDEFHRAILTGL